jgi:hypothetical protein
LRNIFMRLRAPRGRTPFGPTTAVSQALVKTETLPCGGARSLGDHIVVLSETTGHKPEIKRTQFAAIRHLEKTQNRPWNNLLGHGPGKLARKDEYLSRLRSLQVNAGFEGLSMIACYLGNRSIFGVGGKSIMGIPADRQAARPHSRFSSLLLQ